MLHKTKEISLKMPRYMCTTLKKIRHGIWQDKYPYNFWSHYLDNKLFVFNQFEIVHNQ